MHNQLVTLQEKAKLEIASYDPFKKMAMHKIKSFVHSDNIKAEKEKKKVYKKMRHLQSNLLPLCLASFMRLVSLVISGMTLFSLAASLCPFTMTGNTTHRAKMVPEKNRQKVMVN